MSTEQQNTSEVTEEQESAPEQSATETQSPTSGKKKHASVQLKGKGFDEQMDALRPGTHPGFDVQAARLSPNASPLQMKGGGVQHKDLHDLAAQGTQGSGGALPHLDAIQHSFGKHDVSNVQAHTGSAAQEASAAMGAQAYASGNSVAFGNSPDLHTAAHEAAHIVQQRAGVSLKGGVGEAGDSYENHANAVADAVVAGQSAEGLLDQMAGGGGGDAPVQHKGSDAVQLKENNDDEIIDELNPVVIELPDGTRIVSAVEGHSIETRRDATVKEDGTLEATLSNSGTVTDADGTVRTSGTATTATANLEGVNVTHASTERVGDTTDTTTSSIGRDAAGNTTLSTGRSTEVKDGDVTNTRSGTLTAGTDGSVGYSGSNTTVTDMSAEPGSGDYTIKETTSAGVTGNVAEGQVGANVGVSRNDGGVTTSASASGTLDFDSSGRLEGAGGNVKMGHDGVEVSFGGSFKCSAQPPVQNGDQWVVTWVNSTTGTASGGGSNDSAGANMTLSGGSTTTGSRRFASRGAALRFFASGDWALIGLDDAGSLGVDETITDVDSAGLGLGANAKLAGVTVGGSITIGGSTTVQVTGLGDQHVSVRLTESVVLGGSVSLSNGVLGMQFGGSVDNFHGAIVRFDLSTPAGDRAYDLFVANGHVSSSGCELVATFTGDTRARSSGVTGLGGASITNTNTATDEHYDYADGHTVDRQTGTDSIGASIPLVGSYSESDSLAAEHDSSTDERTYSVTNTVNASDTGAVNRDLASSTGRETSGVGTADLANQSERTWTVSSQFSQSDIRRLVEAARAGRLNSASLIHREGSGRTFVSEVSAAGDDWDRIDNALQHFIADTGDSGLQLIRDTISVRPQQDLVLNGDPYMTGAAGHATLARTIERYEAAASSGRSLSGLVGQINTTLTAQRDRLAAISNRATYPDLPDSLRYEEVRRTQREVERLEAVRRQVLDQLQAARASTQATEEHQESDEESVMSMPANEAVLETCTPAASVQAEWESMMELETRAETKRGKAIEHGNEALRQEWIHNGAYCFRNTARNTWGGAGGWLASEGTHLSDYQSADRFMGNGRRTWGFAEGARREYDTAKAEVEMGMATNPEALAGTLEDRLGGKLTQMFNWYSTAKSNFEMATNIFDSIQDQHPDRRNDQFQGRNRRLPNSQRLNQGG